VAGEGLEIVGEEELSSFSYTPCNIEYIDIFVHTHMMHTCIYISCIVMTYIHILCISTFTYIRLRYIHICTHIMQRYDIYTYLTHVDIYVHTHMMHTYLNKSCIVMTYIHILRISCMTRVCTRREGVQTGRQQKSSILPTYSIS